MTGISGQTFSPGVQRIPHQPFPVAEFSEGLMLDREPWLSPRNAFRQVDNARIFRGELKKRNGSSYFSEVGIEDPTPVAAWQRVNAYDYYEPSPNTLKVVPVSASFQHLNGAGATIAAEVNTTKAPIWRESVGSLGRWGASLPGFGVWEWEIVETGTSTRLGWLYWKSDESIPCEMAIDWSLHSGHVDTSVLADGTVSYWYNPGDEVVGLNRYRDATGDYSIACDPDYLYKYDTSAGFYKQQGFDAGASIAAFTGTDEDYFWFWPLDDRLVLTNNVDPPCFWDPTDPAATSVDEMPTDWNTPGTNEIDSCRLFVHFRGRGLYINVTESGTDHPTRCRYTDAGALSMQASGWVDAPRELGEAITAQFIGERLFVGFETGWMELVATGDSVAPFEWRPFISRFGAVSKLSTIQDNERLLSRSKTTLQAIDPNGQYYLDPEIPDLVQGYSADKTELCVGFRNEDQRAHWWTVVDSTSERPENILCATYDEKGNLAWSEYDMRFNVFSYFDSENTPSWNGLGPKTWNDYTGVTWNSARIGIAGFTQAIGGSDSGLIQMFDTALVDFRPDGPASIAFDVTSQRWSPYPGQKAHWGWLDIYATATQAATLTLYFYGDTKSAAHTTKTVTLTPSGASAKVYRRVRVDHASTFHKMRLVSSDDVALSISALVPWFRPAGRLRQFN